MGNLEFVVIINSVDSDGGQYDVCTVITARPGTDNNTPLPIMPRTDVYRVHHGKSLLKIIDLFEKVVKMQFNTFKKGIYCEKPFQKNKIQK